MRTFFNRLLSFTQKTGRTVDLEAELENRLRRIEKAQNNPYAGEADGRYSARRAGAQGLCLRLDAAAAARIRVLLDRGETTIHVPENSTIDRALLGGYATNFRVYERNLAQDLTAALS